MLSAGLVSLNIHEALTFDGTEIVLHPDLFGSPLLLTNETNSSFPSTQTRGVMVGVAAPLEEMKPDPIKTTGIATTTTAAAGAGLNSSSLLQAGDLVEIRVWDAVTKTADAAVTSSSIHNTTLPKPNGISSIMRRRSSPPSSSSALHIMADESAPSTLQAAATRESESNGTALQMMNAATSFVTASEASTLAPDDATAQAGPMRPDDVTAVNNASIPHVSSQRSLDSASAVDSNRQQEDITSATTPHQESPADAMQPTLARGSSDEAPSKTVMAAAASISSSLDPLPPTLPRVPATAPETATSHTTLLPSKPPLAIRNRTTGSMSPVVSDLFGSKTAASLTTASLTTTGAANSSNNNTSLRPQASNGPGNRPRHFRDLSDMTMDTIADYGQILAPNMTNTSEDDDHDVWTQFSNSHVLRQSFCIMVSAKSLTSLKSSARTQISLLRPIADLYGLSSYDKVTIHKVDDEAVWQNVSADFVLVTIKDQFISRGDMQYFVSNLIGSWVYEGERLCDDTKGIQAHAKEIRLKDHHAYSGIITDQTKITFRSRSSRLIWLVQISVEMFDYASPFEVSGEGESRCETYFDKWIVFVKKLFGKWKEQETSHSLTVVFFSRTFIGTVPGAVMPTASAGGADNPAEHRDIYGRRYEDHFRLVIENATSTDLDSVIVKIKEEFVRYPSEVGWNTLTGEASRRPSLASQGNVLEATNVTLNLLQFHYFDRDLNRTGNSLVIISAGNGVFEVDKGLAGITYQRMMDNGIGSDMLSLSLPPLHIAPFFLYTDVSSTTDVSDSDVASTWEVPHWLHLSFISYDRDGAADGSVRPSKQEQKNPFEVTNIGGHSVGANGFLLPTTYYPSEAKTDALFWKANPAERSATQERQLIAGRDFRDILDACRPRHIGEIPSALKTLLCMFDVADTKPPETARTDDDEPTIEEWGALKAGTEGYDSSRLYRMRAVSLGQEPSLYDTSPKFGPVSEPVTMSGARGGTSNLNNALSFDSQHSGSFLGVSYDRPFLANTASPSITGIQLQRSPSFRLKLQSDEDDDDDAEKSGEDASEASTASQGLALDDSGSPTNHDTMKPRNKRSLATQLEELMRNFDASLVTQIMLTAPQSMSPHQEYPAGRHGALHDVLVAKGADTRSATRSGLPPGGLGMALSRYQSAPAGVYDAAADDNEQATQQVTTRVSNATRPTGASYARRQFEMGARGMSPLLLPAVVSSGDKNDAFHPSSYRVIVPESQAETKHAPLTSGRSFVQSYLSKSPPTSQSPTLLLSERGVRRSSLESNETASPERRRRNLSRGSRRRKAFNPFRQQDEDEVLAKKTHNRLRWSHVFPLGEVEFKRHAGPSWKSLTSPAILPLSVDYFPSQQEVDYNYTFSIYNVTRNEFENSPYSSNIDLMWEMVRQRLTQDYQLVPKDHPNVVNFRRETLGRADLANPSSNIENPGTIRAFLSLGYSLQVLTYDPALDVIEVTRYDAKDARTQKSEAGSFKYLYLCRCPTTGQYLPVVQTFTKYSALYNWNKVDRIICGDDDREMREGMRFKRIMFAVLPERCESTDIENCYIEKFRRLMEYFEKLREKDGSSVPLDVKIIRTNDTSEDSDSRKMFSESTPGISWNAMQRFYVRLKKGKNDALEWVEVVIDSTFKTCWSYRIMFQWLVASSNKVEAQVQMLSRRCTQFGLKLVPFPQLSVSKEVFLNPFKAHVTFKIESKESVDRLEGALDRLDYLHDGVFYTDAQAIKDCIPSDYEFGRRWSRTIAGRQFVHRSGTLFVRILTEIKGRAIIIVFNNYNYLNKEDNAKQVCKDVFASLSACVTSLSSENWDEIASTGSIVRAGAKPIEMDGLDLISSPTGSSAEGTPEIHARADESTGEDKGDQGQDDTSPLHAPTEP